MNFWGPSSNVLSEKNPVNYFRVISLFFSWTETRKEANRTRAAKGQLATSGTFMVSKIFGEISGFPEEGFQTDAG